MPENERTFNGLIEIKVYDGTQLYKLGFRANLPQKPHYKTAENSLIYIPVQTVLDSELISEGWEKMFDATYDGDDLWVGIKTSIKWMLTSFDPMYQKDGESEKHYRRLYFEGHTEGYPKSYGV